MLLSLQNFQQLFLCVLYFCIVVFNKLKTALCVILAGEQTGEWKATSKWQETSTTCVELLQMQAILWFEGTQGDPELL